MIKNVLDFFVLFIVFVIVEDTYVFVVAKLKAYYLHQTKEDPYESKALQNTKRGVLHKTISIMQDAFVLSPSVSACITVLITWKEQISKNLYGFRSLISNERHLLTTIH
jgi:hypothetical protein